MYNWIVKPDWDDKFFWASVDLMFSKTVFYKNAPVDFENWLIEFEDNND